MQSTLSERGEAPARQVRLFTRVLNFDDLVVDAGCAVAVGHDALPLTFGRASDDEPQGLHGATLKMPDRWASARHCTVLSLGGADVLVDEGSRNGTWLNGARLARQQPLADGDLFEAGHTLWCYRRVDAQRARALLEAPDGVAFGLTRTRSPRVAALAEDLARVAPTREPVLILGETGTGKESAAAMIHAQSGRAGALRAVDCGAIPDTLFESYLFGHRKGAFTGAHEHRDGELTLADGGTLLLDEVANLSPASQARLLRVLEDGRVVPVGASAARQVDVRWIAATNADLFAGVSSFRDDLLRRLAGYVLRLPPLRERREDLGALTRHALRAAGVTRASITPAAARQLFCGPLTGNVRQLRAALRSASTLAGAEPIEPQHLPPLERSLPTEVAAVERAAEPRPDADAVEAALRATRGNVVRAAERLGVHPRQVYRWIERYQLTLDRYRG